MSAPEEREPPIHRGVIFVEISKEGVCRLTGYTGSKDEGDQNLVMNLSAPDKPLLETAGNTLIGRLISEMFLAFENSGAK